MNRRILLNIGLLLFALALILMVWRETATEQTAEQRLTMLAAEDVTHMSIHRPGVEDIRLRKTGDHWFVESPIETWANGFRLEPLVRIVESPSHARFEAAGLDLGKYQLAPPIAVLRVNGEEIAFGGTEPIDNRRYVRTGGMVHLINDHYFYRLPADVPAAVSNRLLPPGGRLRAISLPGMAMTRDDEGRWTVSPAGALSADAANELADEWGRAQALEVEIYDGDHAPGGSIRVEIDEPAQVIPFDLLSGDHGVMLGRPDLGLLYHLADDQAQRLLSPGAEARDVPQDP